MIFLHEGATASIPTGIRHELRAAPGTVGLLAYLDPAGPAGRAATARIAAMPLRQRPVLVIEEEHPLRIRPRRRSRVPAVRRSLFDGQEIHR
ncbi:hypothetical protein ACFV1N_11615 [Streptosporangium canum]|uniref:hypothetical protein n=1 Tax=Streptosporangium canum TaxID=324952 RepID=UPI0036D135C6